MSARVGSRQPGEFNGRSLNEVAFRAAVQQFVDVVFADDMEFFDSLSERVESSLGSPLAALCNFDDKSALGELSDAVVLVEEIAEDIKQYVPQELSALIERMAVARRGV